MIDNGDAPSLADLAEGALSGPVWDAWAQAHPEEAREVELARRVRDLMITLELREIEVPAGFEARVLELVRNDVTLLQLLDLGISGMGRALLELLDILFSFLPQPAPQPVP